MSTRALYSLQIAQGTTFSTTFSLRHKVVLNSAANLSDTTLNIAPISFPLTAGNTLTFGSTVVTLTANVVLGDRALTIQSLSAPLAKGVTAKGALMDLTGLQARAAIRENYEAAAPLASFVCSISGSEVTISMSSVVTAALPANIQPTKADSLSELQSISFPTPTDAKLFNPGKSSFFWDLELYTSDSIPVVTRYVYGKVLVLAEATR